MAVGIRAITSRQFNNAKTHIWVKMSKFTNKIVFTINFFSLLTSSKILTNVNIRKRFCRLFTAPLLLNSSFFVSFPLSLNIGALFNDVIVLYQFLLLLFLLSFIMSLLLNAVFLAVCNCWFFFSTISEVCSGSSNSFRFLCYSCTFCNSIA